MKKIIGLVVVLVAVIAILGTGTWAYFNDAVQVTSNTVSAGTLYIDQHNSVLGQWSIGPLQPADNSVTTNIKEKTLTVQSGGNINGILNMALSAISTTAGSLTDAYSNDLPKKKAGATGAKIQDDLKCLLYVVHGDASAVYNTANGDFYYDSSFTPQIAVLPAYSGFYALSSLGSKKTFSGSLPTPGSPGSGLGTLTSTNNKVTVHLKYILPYDNTPVTYGGVTIYKDNETQGDSASVDITFYLDQATNTTP